MDETNPTETNRHWTDRDTITVKEASQILGLGRSAAYDAVKRKEIPSLNIGGRILIPVAPLKQMLGYAAVGA
jgi:excisionase family DNA binding protein